MGDTPNTQKNTSSADRQLNNVNASKKINRGDRQELPKVIQDIILAQVSDSIDLLEHDILGKVRLIYDTRIKVLNNQAAYFLDYIQSRLNKSQGLSMEELDTLFEKSENNIPFSDELRTKLVAVKDVCLERNVVSPLEYDFSHANLIGVTLGNFEFLYDASSSGVNFSGANFTDSTFEEGEFSNANLRYADFTNSKLRDICMSDADLTGAIFTGATLQEVYLVDTNITDADFRGASFLYGIKATNLTGEPKGLPQNYQYVTNQDNQGFIIGPGVNLEGARLMGADLQDEKLQGASLRRASLSDAKLNRAQLQGAYLVDATLQEADLSGAHLEETRLNRAQLQGADLKGANLREAGLYEADLRGANMEEVNLQGARTINLKGEPEVLPEGYQYAVNKENQGFIIGPGVNLEGADLRGADLSNVSLESTHTSNLQGKPESLPEGYQYLINEDNQGLIIGPGVSLEGANLRGVDLSETNMEGVYLLNACTSNLQGEPKILSEHYQYVTNQEGKHYLIGPGVNLEEENLAGIHFTTSFLARINLAKANLNGAVFPSHIKLRRANLSGAKLQGVQLTGACLRGANLSGAHLEEANLSNSRFQQADLQNAQLQDAQLTGCRFYNTTKLEGVKVNTEFMLMLRPQQQAQFKLSEPDENGVQTILKK